MKMQLYLMHIIQDKKTLHWDDKYGWDAPRDEGNEAWSIDKANAKGRIRLMAMAQKAMSGEKSIRQMIANMKSMTLFIL